MSSPKVNSTFPLRRRFPGTAPVFEGWHRFIFCPESLVHTRLEDENGENMIPVTAHMRRTSNQLASRFTEPKTTALPEPHLERGAGFLRRLSLSNAPFAKVSLSWSSRLWPPY